MDQGEAQHRLPETRRGARNSFIKRLPLPIEARQQAAPRLAASGLFRKEGAPALRTDCPLDRFAGVRRLEKVTPIAALCTFRLILVRDRVLRHLGLCGRKIRPEALNDRSATPHRSPCAGQKYVVTILSVCLARTSSTLSRTFLRSQS